jgi:hypothetical protein
MILRLIGAVMIVAGLLFCMTIIGAVVGIPFMLLGLVFVIAGRRPAAPIVVNVHHGHPGAPDTARK